MKLLRLKADGFGLLRGEYHFDPARVAIVVDDNERGKTSLLGAIVAGLYGLDGDGRRARGLVTPLERWRPWDGGDYRVELDLESGGETYYVKRDLGRGAVEVWNARGQNVAHEFLAGKDDYAVGHRLLGLDAEEFARCALWRQGELEHVVPHEEKERRISTLHARLEQAADTRAGDASATEALRALRAALERFHSPLLGSTLRIENTLARLELQRDTVETELRALEHEHREAATPLEDLARLDEEDRAARDRVACLERRLARLRAADARARLERDTQRRLELDVLRAEAAALAGAAAVPENAESTLRVTVAALAAARRTRDSLAERRAAARAECARLEETLVPFEAWAAHGADEADHLAGVASALRRAAEEHDRVRAELDRISAEVLGADRDSGRIDALVTRFEAAADEPLGLLRRQPRLALTLQGEVATAEFARKSGRDTLRAIDRWKRPRYWLAAVLAGLGIGSAAVAAVLAPAGIRAYALGGAAALAVGGLAGFALVARARAREAEAARQRIDGADEQLRQTRLRSIENDTRLAALAAEMGCADVPALLDEWSEFQGVRDRYGPLRAARERLAGLERQRADLLAQAAALLGGAGGAADAEDVERAAAAIRRRLEHVRALADTRRRLDALARECEAADAVAAGHHAAAVAALAAAGLTHDGGEDWAAPVEAVAARARQATRHRTLTGTLIPAIERELMNDRQRESCAAEIARAAVDPAGDGPESADPAEIAHEIASLRQRLDGIGRSREELRLRVEGVARRYHEQHPEKLERIAALEREIGRVTRFREAVTVAVETLERVALDTHRRWAAFLNERVTALLGAIGSSIARVRFGEDLDFAVTLADGRQLARGRAIHQLSSGARDQLHLAVRLAISEYLSRGAEAVPLLVDDCFATSDDGRARNGMRLLLEEFSRRHQIVLATCHRERYRALAEMDPGLYAERVQWVELRPAAVA